MKRHAILTFDYEVFLGAQTGTIENCVLKPTNSILGILKENNAKAIFFVDATWLLFLKENFPDDFRVVAGQLKNIVESGSSVQLHLHPQWINAYKEEEQIIFKSFKHYKLHSLSHDEILILFKESVDLLQSITDQTVSCFRAGGWCVEPFSIIREAFETSGIKYDFSVVPGVSIKEGKDYDFDFSKAPELPFYKFQNNVNEPEDKGSFIEVPLSTYQNNAAYRVVNKALGKIKNDKIFGDGTGIKVKSVYQSFYQLIRFSRGMLTLDKTSNLIFRYLLMTHFRKSPLLVIVSHPKTMSPEALINLVYVTRKYITLNSSDIDKFFIN